MRCDTIQVPMTYCEILRGIFGPGLISLSLLKISLRLCTTKSGGVLL